MADIVFHLWPRFDVFKRDTLEIPILEMLDIVSIDFMNCRNFKNCKIRRFSKNLFIYIYNKMLNWAFVIYLSDFIIKKYK